MRLIDADKLLEETIKDRDYAEKNGFLDMYYERQVLIDRIESQPTAYDVDKLAEWLEELKDIKSDGFTDDLLNMGFTKGYSKALEELKVIKEMDLSIPQHFTKEQSDWIKKYCINRNKEFYNKALDDFVKFASDMPTVEMEDGTIRPMRLEEMAEKLKEKYNEQRNNNE